MARPIKVAPALAAAALALMVAACGHNPFAGRTLTERECMARAMYFESNRSSEEGMSAVGTVVMNRLKSGRYPGSVCGVVGQRNQFASGVLSNPVSGRSWALALSKADAVIAGERHARVGEAMHFHTAGYTFPYRNMAYVVAAGGNVFYEKRQPGTFTPIHPNVMVAQAERERRRPSEAIVVARAEQAEQTESTRVAGLEQRRERAAMPTRTEQLRSERDEPSARQGDRPASSRERTARRPDDGPPARAKPERVRLAHLDDEDMPKALRQRSDAVAPARSAAIPLPARSESASGKAAMARSEVRGNLPVPAPVSRSATKAEPARPQLAKLARNEPGKGELLPYRGAAKPAAAKASAPETAAKLGWKRGPDPATPTDRTKTAKRQ